MHFEKGVAQQSVVVQETTLVILTLDVVWTLALQTRVVSFC